MDVLSLITNEDCFYYDGIKYNYYDVERVEFGGTISRSLNKTKLIYFNLYLSIVLPNRSIEMKKSSIGGGIVTNKNIEDFDKMHSTYTEISNNTLQYRLKKYIESINNNGYFDYWHLRFFIDGRVIIREKNSEYFNLTNTKLITYNETSNSDENRKYGEIYVINEESGILKKIVREFVPISFPISIDRDVLIILLKAYYKKNIYVISN